MLLEKLAKKGLIQPPNYVISNCCYLTVMGSHAYGVADTSVKAKLPDMDCYGVCIPPKDFIFPHLRGEIVGFGTPGPRFEQFQKHHVFDVDAHGGSGQEYDFQIYSILKYFELCRQCNPNMIDSLFTHESCVIHCTQVGRLIRDNRKLFLSKLAWKTFRGYMWSQLKKESNCIENCEMKNFIQFEESHNIPHNTTYQEVLDELSRRGLEI